jgi:glycosyltransferase involved in cell wall biosynthesis
MNFGLPVIHSDQPALVEVAAVAALAFQTNSPADLTEKMILLEEDETLRTNLILQGKERVKEFTAEKFIAAFHRLILSA